MKTSNPDPANGLSRYRETQRLAVSGSVRLAPQESDYTWEQVVRVLVKHRIFAIMVAGTLTAMVVLIAFLLRDSYRPVARINMEPPASGIKPLHEIEPPTQADDESYLETQVQILKSDSLAVSVIRELHLDEQTNSAEKTPAKDVGGKASGDPQTTAGAHSLMREQLELATLKPSEVTALERFRKNLTVNAVRNTRLVEAGYADRDPIKAQLITNTVVSKFIDGNFKHRYSTTMQVSEWLSAQLEELRAKVDASNRAVSDYQKKTGLIELDDRDVPMSQLMSEVNHQLSDAQANRIEAEAFVRMINLAQADSIPAVRDSRVYQDLQMRYAESRSQLAQVKTVYGDENTNVKKLEEQTVEIGKQLDAERDRIAGRLRVSFAAAKERERLMLKSREGLRAQMGNVSSQLVGYHLLKNEAMASAELYNTLQARLQEAGIYAGLKSSNIRVVDLATNLRKPTGPNRALLISSGALVACLIAVVGCFVKESMDNTVRTPDDIRSWIGLRSLALLPSVETAKTQRAQRSITQFLHLKTVHQADETRPFMLMPPLSAGAEAMRDLRTSLLSSSELPEVILISSSMEGEGKTTVAVNFAISLAQLGRTCLVDGDLRQPAVTRSFGMVEKAGLSEVLGGRAQLSAALFPADIASNLWILASGQSQESPADVLASSRIHDVCNELRKTFAFVVIDTPPVIRFSDARSLARLADEVVLVGRYGITTRRAIQRSVDLLRDAQVPVAGFVLNDIDLSSSDYHYFTYGYSKEMNRQAIRSAAEYGTGEPGDAPKSKGAHA